MSGPLDLARKAFADLAAVGAVVEAEKSKLARIEYELAEARSDRDRFTDMQDRETSQKALIDIEAVLDGGDLDALEVNPKRAKRIDALGKRVAALTGAIPLQQRIIREAQQREIDAQVPFTAAILDAMVRLQQPAVERLPAVLTDLATVLKDLLVVDMVTAGTIGDRYAVPAGTAPLPRHRQIVQKIVEAVPERMRPSVFNNDQITDAAKREAGPILATIKSKG